MVRAALTVDEAWAASFLARMPARAARALRDSVRVENHEAGDVVYDQLRHHDAADLALVLKGVLRVSLCWHTGREVTLRYAEPGSVVGLPAVVAGGTTDTIHAVTDSRLARVDSRTLRYFAKSDASVAWVLCQELAKVHYSVNERWSYNLFQSVTGRVAAALLDMSSRTPRGTTVKVSHEAIADAIGSVREVVSRSIRQLRELGLIERQGVEMVLLDPEALARLAGR